MVNEFREWMEARDDGFGDETFTTEQIKELLHMDDFEIVHEPTNVNFDVTRPIPAGSCIDWR